MEKKYLSRDKIIGKQVIDSKGMIIGNVKDLSLDFETKGIAIVINTKAGTEIVIEGGNVINVGDVILLSKEIELPEAPAIARMQETPQVIPSPASAIPPTKLGLCKVCGFQNDENSRFCIKCGAKL
jgi:sporulation protein YlmC with PRC-barrel domain